jgi:hypothetical protein
VGHYFHFNDTSKEGIYSELITGFMPTFEKEEGILWQSWGTGAKK